MNKFVVSSLASLVILSLAAACAPSKRQASPAANKSGANPANNNGKGQSGSGQGAASDAGSTTIVAGQKTPAQIQSQPAIDTTTIDPSKVTNISSYVSTTAALGTSPSDSTVALKIEMGSGSPITLGASFDPTNGGLKVSNPNQSGVTVSCGSPSTTAADYAKNGASACTQVIFNIVTSTKNSSGAAQAGAIQIKSSRGMNFSTSFDFGDDKGVINKDQHVDFAALSKMDSNSLVVVDSSGNPVANVANNKTFINIGIDGLYTDASKTTDVTDAIVVPATSSSDEKHYNISFTGLWKFDGTNLTLSDANKGDIDSSNTAAPRYIRHMIQTQADSTIKPVTLIATIDTSTTRNEAEVKKQTSDLTSIINDPAPDSSASPGAQAGATNGGAPGAAQNQTPTPPTQQQPSQQQTQQPQNQQSQQGQQQQAAGQQQNAQQGPASNDTTLTTAQLAQLAANALKNAGGGTSCPTGTTQTEAGCLTQQQQQPPQQQQQQPQPQQQQAAGSPQQQANDFVANLNKPAAK